MSVLTRRTKQLSSWAWAGEALGRSGRAAAPPAWPDGLREIIAGVASGMSLSRAVGGLAVNGPRLLRDAFQRFPTLVGLVGVVPALETIREQLGDPTSDRVSTTYRSHRRPGTGTASRNCQPPTGATVSSIYRDSTVIGSR